MTTENALYRSLPTASRYPVADGFVYAIIFLSIHVVSRENNARWFPVAFLVVFDTEFSFCCWAALPNLIVIVNIDSSHCKLYPAQDLNALAAIFL